ncbi:nucleoplasmin-like protein NO29 isoform X1 [Chamaea fasciata]|uniref:nucleoplasmin-like protein NO29 isoform X1 n=1 Tax=Chamaea fasciata TaxID=190680 RepID=UPI00336AA50D
MGSSFELSRSLSEGRSVVALWGCQLGTGARSCVLEEDDDFLEHLVLLRTICLGADTGDELHVVAVDSKNTSGEQQPVPIAALRSSLLTMWDDDDDVVSEANEEERSEEDVADGSSEDGAAWRRLWLCSGAGVVVGTPVLGAASAPCQGRWVLAEGHKLSGLSVSPLVPSLLVPPPARG